MMASLLGCTVRGGVQGRQGKADSRLVVWCLCLALLLPAGTATAGEEGPVTGYPIPRFVSLRVDKAHLRVGPDKYFPIRIVLLRKGMPLKVVDEFKLWRKVQLYDGVEGWLHQSLISGRRTFLIGEREVAMRDSAGDEGAVVARLEPGALAYVDECAGQWCELSVSGYEGWVPRDSGWGTLPGEDFAR
jgi:SH3-like domain-containing protein